LSSGGKVRTAAAVAPNSSRRSNTGVNQAQVGIAGGDEAVRARRADGADTFPEASVTEAQVVEIEVFEGEVGVGGKVVHAENSLHADGEMTAPSGPGN
jgi:hypothetical protein